MKKTTKQSLASILTIALMAGVLGGCSSASSQGSSSSGSSGSSSGPSTEMEKIVVWSDNASEKELRVQQIDEFNNTVGKEQGINIEYTVYGSNFTDTIQIAAKSGEAPDMYRADNKWLPSFVEAGYVVPLNDMPGGQELIDKYDGLLVNQYHIFGDKVYTLPYSLTTYKFVVNADLFKAAGLEVPTNGWTWADVREDAKKITEASNGTAYGFGLSLKDLWTISSYLTMPAGTNVGNYGFDYETQQFDFEAMEPMISEIYGMVKDGSVFPGFEALNGDGVRAQFSEGVIGILGAANFDVGVYNDQFPAKCDWQVVPEPSFTEDGSPYKEFVQTTQLLVMGTKAQEHPEKAMSVYNFFYSDENAAEMYENGLYIPVRDEAIAMAKSEPSAKGFKEFAAVPEKFVMSPMPDNLLTVEGTAYREAIVNFLSGVSGDDAMAVLKDVDERYNAALKSLSPDQLALYKLPEGTVMERSK